MDYGRLASELLRALRGKRSQVTLMRRLGYSANAPYLWEAGRRFPPAQVLFQLGALNKLPIARFLEFAGLAQDSLPHRMAWSARNTGAWLSKLLGETPATEIARAVRSDRTTVSRWLHGATEPRVPELLELLDRMTHRLVEFVDLFVSARQLRSLRSLATALAAQRRSAYDVPWTHAVLRALELAEYRDTKTHVPGVIAGAVGVSVNDEARLLGELHAARLIRRKAGKWLAARVLTVDTRAQPEDDRRLKLHWAQVGVERLQAGPRGGGGRRRAGPFPADAFYSFNLCAVSRTDYERIRELHLEYYERVRRLVAESSVAERVVLLNQQLIPLDAEVRQGNAPRGK